jgi:hypothetical protein
MIIFTLSQFYYFIFQEGMPDSYNSIYLDFDTLPPQSLSQLDLELGYFLIDEKKTIIPLDRRLYDVDFISREFKVVKGSKGPRFENSF